MYIIIAIILFGIIIAVHEFGHFSTAKLTGVRVDEFSIGMGPAIWKKQKGETLYSLRVIPIGGYCMMAGEDEASDDPGALTNKGFFTKLLILSAGSIMNFILGLLLVLTMTFTFAGINTPVIEEFMDGCPYESADGFQVGDRFYRVDGQRIYLYSDLGDAFAKGSGVYDFVIVRDGEKIRLDGYKLELLQYEESDTPKFGFMFGGEEFTLSSRLSYTWNQSMEFSRWVWMSLKELVKGAVKLDDMSGPVGIVDLMNEVGESASEPSEAIYSMLYLGAFIAINLAIMNMLPIPALDGGRIFLLIVTLVIETATGKKPDPKYEGFIHAAGMILLLGLMAVIMYNDILRIIVR